MTYQNPPAWQVILVLHAIVFAVVMSLIYAPPARADTSSDVSRYLERIARALEKSADKCH